MKKPRLWSSGLTLEWPRDTLVGPVSMDISAQRPRLGLSAGKDYTEKDLAFWWSFLVRLVPDCSSSHLNGQRTIPGALPAKEVDFQCLDSHFFPWSYLRAEYQDALDHSFPDSCIVDSCRSSPLQSIWQQPKTTVNPFAESISIYTYTGMLHK